MIAQHYRLNITDQTASAWLLSVVQWAWKIKLGLHLENEFFAAMREKALMYLLKT